MKNTNTWWFGFKEAEELLKAGYEFKEKYLGGQYYCLWFEKVEDGIVCQRGIPCNLYERAEGIKDYLEYFKNNLNKY